nr:MAG TPA: hypothetical protein [Caudoviricetes sp.]
MSNIYDDVALLQEQMDEVLSELPYKLSNASTNISDEDLNLLVDELIFGYGNGCVNKPTGSANGYFVNIPHSTIASYNKQFWIERTNNKVWTRYEENSVWSAWVLLGCENVVVGLNVPIGRMFNGKPVYCKTVNIGTLPTSGTKAVSSGLTPSEITVLEIKGSATGEGDWLPIPNAHPVAANIISCYLRNDGKVVVAVGKDRSAVTATVSIYYVVN